MEKFYRFARYILNERFHDTSILMMVKCILAVTPVLPWFSKIQRVKFKNLLWAIDAGVPFCVLAGLIVSPLPGQRHFLVLNSR